MLQNVCNINSPHVIVHATHLVYIDTDVVNCNLKSLAIFAKTWLLNGTNRRINLLGRNGNAPANSNGGKDGDPGQCGGDGGHFLGFYKKVQGGTRLHIDVSGGNGGDGQNGRSGLKGNNGSVANDGKPGEKGGNGGAGGVPGIPGKVLLFGIRDQREKFTVTNNTGKPGNPGKEGIGGRGGAGGQPLLEIRCSAYGGIYYDCLETVLKPGGKPGRNGENGIAGANSVTQECAAAFSVPVDLWAEQISHYRALLLQSNDNDNVLLANELDTNSMLSSIISAPLIFAHDFINLANMKFLESRSLNYIKEFENLLNRTQRYEVLTSEAIKNHESTNYFLTYLQNSVGIQLNLLNQRLSLMIVNVPTYYKTISTDVENIEKSILNSVLAEERENYMNDINQQAKSVEMQITNTVFPEINRLKAKFLQLLDKATEEMLNNLEQRKILQKKSEKAAHDALMQGILLDLLAMTANFVFPRTKGISPLINRLGQKTAATADSYEILISNLNLQISQTGSVTTQSYSMLFRILQFQVLSLTTFLQSSSGQNMTNLREVVASATQILESEIPSGIPSSCERILHALSAESKLAGDPQLKETVSRFITNFTWIQDNFKLLNSSVPSDLSKDKNGNIVLSKSTKQAPELIEKAEDDFIVFRDAEKPYMAHAASSIVSGITRMDAHSLKLELDNFLGTIKRHVDELMKGLSVEKDFTETIKCLQNAMAQTSHLYGRLQGLEENKKLAGFISKSNFVQLQLDGITEYAELLSKINLHNKLDLAKREYQKILQTSMLQMFPFEHKLSCEHNNVSIPNKNFPHCPNIATSTNNSHRVRECAHQILKQIKKLAECIQRDDAIVDQEDSMIMETNFSARPGSEPFCRWHHSTWRTSITNFFRGEKILMKCNFHLHREKAAVKFRTAGLNLRCHNSSYQTELNKNLAHFHMRLKHSGQNMYSINSTKFRFDWQSIPMVSCFPQSREAHRTTPSTCDYNLSKKKIGNGKPMLSPYTYWEFQVTDPLPKKGLGITNLINDYNMCGGVDLELTGNGTYIKAEELSSQQLKIEAFYDHFKVKQRNHAS